jgi:hypothetical protein
VGQILDLRPVFDEKRLIQESVRVERCSVDLLVRALERRRSSLEASLAGDVGPSRGIVVPLRPELMKPKV